MPGILILTKRTYEWVDADTIGIPLLEKCKSTIFKDGGKIVEQPIVFEEPKTKSNPMDLQRVLMLENGRLANIMVFLC
jgi:hypothetical protein